MPAPKTSKAARTRLQLLNAAERLFARHGIEGTSLREIAAQAKQTNNFAVQYHFGSKRELIEALLQHRMLQMEPERERLLAAAKQKGRLGDLRTLLEIICLPHLELVDETGAYPYAEFLAQYLLRYTPPAFTSPSTTSEHPVLANLLVAQALVQKRLPGVPAKVVQRRLSAVVQSFLSELICKDSDTTDARQKVDPGALADTLSQMTAALEAPYDPMAVVPVRCSKARSKI